MGSNKVTPCKVTKESKLKFRIITKLHSKCPTPCCCFSRSNCLNRAKAEKYFLKRIKPVLDILLGNGMFVCGVYVYEHGIKKYKFKFSISVNRDSFIKRNAIRQVLKKLQREEKNIARYSFGEKDIRFFS